MFDAEDRLFLLRAGLRVGAAVAGVLIASATLGAAWRIFWMVAGGS